MPRQVATSVENSFVGGEITEASGLNFPENACTSASNCVFDFIGEVERRPGFNFESGFNNIVISKTGKSVTTFLWRNVNGDGNTYIFVLQVGATLYFFNVGTSGGAISAQMYTSTVDLTAFMPSGAPNPGTTDCQYDAGLGYLFVTHPTLEPFAVKFHTDTQVFETVLISISIRDFEGFFPDGTLTNRPTGLTNIHQYNLLNQGWTTGGGTLLSFADWLAIYDPNRLDPNSAAKYAVYAAGFTSNTDTIGTWHTAKSNYPSNADVWFLFKNTSNIFDPATTSASIVTGNTPAPNGHYLLSAFNQDRSSASGISGFAVVTSTYQRPATVGFYAGRVFYAGVNAVGFNTTIYFSQLIDLSTDPTTQFGQCYQIQDPTNQDAFDLLPTDGGVIKIANCGTVYKLFPIQGALIVFASNGIWTITGSQGLGFTATDYSINKLSSIKCISSTSFVDVLGFPMWWTREGVYTIRIDISAGGLRIDSITDTTIRTLYQNIPYACRQQARGYYNPSEFLVQWLYRSTAIVTTPDDNYKYDTVLSYNTITGSFSRWTIATDLCTLTGITVVDASDNTETTDNVFVGASNVLIGTSQVVITTTTATEVNFDFKYLVSYINPQSSLGCFTFAQTRDFTYTDFVLFDGTGQDFTSTFTSGYKIHGQALHKFQTNYVYMYVDNTAPNAYTISGYWDYAVSINSGKQSAVQVYISGGLNSHILQPDTRSGTTMFGRTYKRWKLPGRGTVVQLHISSVTGYPFKFSGWALNESMGTGV